MSRADQRPMRPVTGIDLPSPERRRFRRIRARALKDPLSQSVLALLGTLLSVGWGIGLLTSGRAVAAALTLSLGAIAVAIYVGIAARAFKRDKAVRYWEDRRELRLRLSRKEAHLDLHRGVMRAIRVLDREEQGNAGRAQEALAELVEGVHKVLDTTCRDDVAAALVLEVGQWYRILHSSTSKRSRWEILRPGKHCPVDGTFERKLTELAAHHRTFGMGTAYGHLRVVLLSESPFNEADDAFLEELPDYLALIIDRWNRSAAPHEPYVSLVR
jgi:hypothetical protein